MEKAEPTREDLEAVAALLPDLERVEAAPMKWLGGERGADGAIQMPHVEYPDEVQRVLGAIYQRHFFVAFDWQSWDWKAEGFGDPTVIARASLHDVRRLLTLHARADRFSEGHFGEMVASGHIAALLRRLGELAANYLTG